MSTGVAQALEEEVYDYGNNTENVEDQYTNETDFDENDALYYTQPSGTSEQRDNIQATGQSENVQSDLNQENFKNQANFQREDSHLWGPGPVPRRPRHRQNGNSRGNFHALGGRSHPNLNSWKVIEQRKQVHSTRIALQNMRRGIIRNSTQTSFAENVRNQLIGPEFGPDDLALACIQLQRACAEILCLPDVYRYIPGVNSS